MSPRRRTNYRRWNKSVRSSSSDSNKSTSLPRKKPKQTLPTYDEKIFFKSTRLGNIEEMRKHVEAARVEDAARAQSTGGSPADRRHTLGWTALMVAAANGRANVVQELLRLGANVNLPDQYAGYYGSSLKTPYVAIQRRDDEFCVGMDHFSSFVGWTALQYAALANSIHAVRVLLDAGADPTARNHNGSRALDYTQDPSVTRNAIVEATRHWEYEARKRAAEERHRFPLEQRLRKHLVGQRAAIEGVAAAVRSRESGWADDEHPLVLLFLGSSGIGKTELAKQLARYMHGEDTSAFIRLDMSEYQGKYDVSKMIGAPPGYVGYLEGGQLTGALARRSDAVVLFDEVDKAHTDVLTVLLQLFDEGRLTDSKGKVIDCKNAIFVMTSNLAGDEIAQHGQQLQREADARAAVRLQSAHSGHDQVNAEEDSNVPIEVSRHFKDTVVRPILKRHFKRDEFLGRIDEMVYFLPFSRQELLALVEHELEARAERGRRCHGVELRWEDGVLGALADCYDVYYGARSIQHEVDRSVISQLARAHSTGRLPRGSKVLITARDGRLAMLLRQKDSDDYEPIDLPKNTS